MPAEDSCELDRRRLLRASMLLGAVNLTGLAGCATASPPTRPAWAAGGAGDIALSAYDPIPPLAPVRAHLDLTPRSHAVPAGATPFPVARVRRTETLMFNVADYGHTLMNDFLTAGGVIRRREFHAPAELAQLPQKVVIDCPGYGARALWRDESIVPVRGQIGWLIPQPEVRYGFYYRDVGVLPRRDGIVVQALDGGDMKGYGDADETPDRAESERAVAAIAPLFAQRQASP